MKLPAVALIIVFISLTFLSLSSAIEWPLGKQESCVFLNKTEPTECDKLWCEIISCDFDVNRTACICYDQTTTNNANITLNTSEFYNKSEIQSFAENLTTHLKQYSDNNTRELRDSVSDRLENETKQLAFAYTGSGNSSSNNEPAPWYAWFIGTLAVVGLLGFLVYNKANEKMKLEARTAIREPYRRTQQNLITPTFQQPVNYPTQSVQSQPQHTTPTQVQPVQVQQQQQPQPTQQPTTQPQQQSESPQNVNQDNYPGY